VLLQLLAVNVREHVQGQMGLMNQGLKSLDGRVDFYLKLVVELFQAKLFQVRGFATLTMVKDMVARGHSQRLFTSIELIERLRVDGVRQATVRLVLQ
jgi:hypothetical protein